MVDGVDLGQCFDTLYETLDIMIETYSKMEGFKYVTEDLKRVRLEVEQIAIDAY